MRRCSVSSSIQCRSPIDMAITIPHRILFRCQRVLEASGGAVAWHACALAGAHALLTTVRRLQVSCCFACGARSASCTDRARGGAASTLRSRTRVDCSCGYVSSELRAAQRVPARVRAATCGTSPCAAPSAWCVRESGGCALHSQHGGQLRGGHARESCTSLSASPHAALAHVGRCDAAPWPLHVVSECVAALGNLQDRIFRRLLRIRSSNIRGICLL